MSITLGNWSPIWFTVTKRYRSTGHGPTLAQAQAAPFVHPEDGLQGEGGHCNTDLRHYCTMFSTYGILRHTYTNRSATTVAYEPD